MSFDFFGGQIVEHESSLRLNLFFSTIPTPYLHSDHDQNRGFIPPRLRKGNSTYVSDNFCKSWIVLVPGGAINDKIRPIPPLTSATQTHANNTFQINRSSSRRIR